jgi:biofilm PGA synthesis N-glycosyltransferase PgaC
MYAKLFIILLSLSALWYMTILFVITAGWLKLKPFQIVQRSFHTRLSLVIALRNEAENLPALLNDIEQQTYPSDLWEILFVNDHSEDNSLNLLRAFQASRSKHNVRIIEAKGEGKKQALLEGIKQAEGTLIVSTDADCRLPQSWLTRMVSFYEQNKPIMILGLVAYRDEQNLLQNLFSLDFLSLVASGAGSMAMHLPLMGNGANLAFEKDAFLEAGAEAQHQHYASGDDVFLIHYLFKKYGKQSVQFLKNKESIITTPPPRRWCDFIQQRIRWGSKAKGYQLLWPLQVALAVFLLNTLLVLTLAISFVVPWFLFIFIVFIFLKFLIDLPLMQSFSEFSNKRNLIKYLFPFEILYPFYIVYAAWMALFSTYEWKGRKSLH